MNDNSEKSNKTLMIGGVIAAVLVIAAGAVYMASNNGSTTPSTIQEDLQETDMMIDDTTMGTEMDPGTSMMVDDMDQALEIEVEGGSFYFDPDEIRVPAGQTVTITLNSVDMMHDFVIDELDVRTDIIEGGESTSVTFTAPSEPGEYEFYCSVGEHRQQGMFGTLIVE